ncbi:uncharacterized protein [Amphiura filiformis]|uniref:uncharacterized protein n=1 Tax=Amphiura filiformis TaxID=82378 RepID=UPI003B218FF8
MSKIKDGLPITECRICNIPGTKPIAYCLDCQEALCQPCHASHESFKVMKHHNILKVEDHDVLKGGLQPEQCCSKHREVKRFYCKTCDEVVCGDCILKSFCFDHLYMTLKDASTEQLRQLNTLIYQCKFTVIRCQFALKKTEELETKFADAVETSRVTLNNTRNECISKLDESFASFENNVMKIEETGLQAIGEVKTNLQSDYDAVRDVIHSGASAMESSKFEIVSKFTMLSNKLQEIGNLRIIPADASLSKMEVMLPSVPFYSKSSWKRIQTIDAKCYLNSTPVVRIESHSNGNISIVMDCKLVILSELGELIHTSEVPPKDGVIILSDGGFISYNNSRLAVHQLDGKGHSSFSLLGANGIPLPFHKPVMTSDSKDGSLINSFITSSSPRHLAAVGNNEDIIIIFYDNTVQLVKYSGDNVRIIPSPPDVTHWAPRDVWCCGNELYIVNASPVMKIFSYTLCGIYLAQVDVDFDISDQVGVSLDGKKLFVLKETSGMIQVYEKE